LRSALCCAALLSFTLVAFGEVESAPTATELLNDVIARLPSDPLLIVGDITLRRRKGFAERELQFDMAVHWGMNPSVARYTVRDALGKELEQLTVLRMAGGRPVFQYASGEPLEPKATPNLFTPIQDTNLSWMDLTLSFLWWPNGRIVDTDTVKGYDCYVVEVMAPGAQPEQYAKVRVWIAKKIHMLLQATGYDAEDEPMRRLWVKSFKKINEQWMVKDLLIQGQSNAQRTELRVRDVTPLAAPSTGRETLEAEGDDVSGDADEGTAGGNVPDAVPAP